MGRRKRRQKRKSHITVQKTRSKRQINIQRRWRIIGLMFTILTSICMPLYFEFQNEAWQNGVNASLSTVIAQQQSMKTHVDFHLRWVDLSGVKMSGAALSYSNLSGANLSGSDLSGADLSEINLSNASLTATDLDVANLSGADLRDAKGITSHQLNTTSDLSGAILPNGTKHP